MWRLCHRVSLLLLGVLLVLTLCSCTGRTAPDAESGASITGHLDLAYATQFDVAYRSDGTCLLTIANTDRYLLVPTDKPTPQGESDSQGDEQGAMFKQTSLRSIPTRDILASRTHPARLSASTDGITRISYPIHNGYLAASSTMDFFRQLNALDSIRLTSTKAQDWSLPKVAEALKDGSMLYAGKYSAPDYELLLEQGTQVAIESTMIHHAPEVAERLSALGIPVLVERSSYEKDPLGRLEWIKLYGLLTGRLDEAQRFFDEQVAAVQKVSSRFDGHRPTVAFFSISANGHAVVRKPGDYVSQMIDLAGGNYFLESDNGNEDDTRNALSTMNMEMERFYEEAREADVIIYNSAIDNELQSIDDLVAKNPRLADFTAVRNQNVWCTGKDLFQQPTCIAQLVSEMNSIFCGTADDDSLTHLYRVDWENGR